MGWSGINKSGSVQGLKKLGSQLKKWLMLFENEILLLSLGKWVKGAVDYISTHFKSL